MTATQTPGAGVEGEAHASAGPPASCRTCGGDQFTFHLSPTNGAVEIDGPCPTCTPRSPR